MEFAPQKNAHPALHVDDVAATRAELEAKGVEFAGDILDTGVCHMAFFTDPDGNDLMLHSRYAPPSRRRAGAGFPHPHADCTIRQPHPMSCCVMKQISPLSRCLRDISRPPGPWQGSGLCRSH